jgi:hypothetical protein
MAQWLGFTNARYAISSHCHVAPNLPHAIPARDGLFPNARGANHRQSIQHQSTHSQGLAPLAFRNKVVPAFLLQ